MENRSGVYAPLLKSFGQKQSHAIPAAHNVVSHVVTAQLASETRDKWDKNEGVTNAMADTETAAFSNLPAYDEDYGQENTQMEESVIDNVLKIRGVKNAILVSNVGEVITSTINNVEFNEFIGFFAGIAEAFENNANLGNLISITLKSNKEDNLTLYKGDEQTLCILSSRKTPVRQLNKQVDDLLQWGEK